jgi:uncharacterized BrkB/YihY/UPF0761 family membrane protein
MTDLPPWPPPPHPHPPASAPATSEPEPHVPKPDAAPESDGAPEPEAALEPDYAPPPDDGTAATAGLVSRAKGAATHAKERADSVRADLESRRGESRTIDAAFGTWERDTSVGGGVLAGAIAFRLFLLMVPYVYVFVVGLGVAADASGKSTQDLAQQAGVAGLIAKSMSDLQPGSAWGRIVALVVGLYFVFITARAAVKVLYAVNALVWGVPMRRVANLSRAAIGLVLVLTLGVALTQLTHWLRDRSFIGGFLATVLVVAIPAVILLVTADRFFPHPDDVGWRELIPGAVLVGVGIEALSILTVYWIAHLVASKTETYGAIGTALAILFWAYVLGRILTAGATLNATVWYRDHPPDAPT